MGGRVTDGRQGAGAPAAAAGLPTGLCFSPRAPGRQTAPAAPMVHPGRGSRQGMRFQRYRQAAAIMAARRPRQAARVRAVPPQPLQKVAGSAIHSSG